MDFLINDLLRIRDIILALDIKNKTKKFILDTIDTTINEIEEID